jgi:hypothetical protein
VTKEIEMMETKEVEMKGARMMATTKMRKTR